MTPILPGLGIVRCQVLVLRRAVNLQTPRLICTLTFGPDTGECGVQIEMLDLGSGKFSLFAVKA